MVEDVSTLPPVEEITDDMPLDDKVICSYIVTMVQQKRVVDGIGDFRKLEGLKWSLPLKDPALTLDEIISSCEQQADEAMKKRYPPEEMEKRRQEIRRQAQERYTMIRPGEKVKLVLRDGVGSNATVEGNLSQVTSDHIVVDGRTIYRGDLSVDDQSRIFEDANEKSIKEYCFRQEASLLEEIQMARNEMLRELQPERFAANGYIPDIRERASGFNRAKPALWMTRIQLVEHIFQVISSYRLMKYQEQQR